MRSLLISHIDLDGVTPFILQRVFADKLPFDSVMMLNYDFEKDEATTKIIESYDRIVLVDLSSSEEYFLHLTRDLNKRVVVYDHHDSSMYLDNYRGCVHDNERCGSKIFFDEYMSPRVRRVSSAVARMIDLVDTYDRWQVDNPLWEEALSLNRVFNSFKNYDIDGLDSIEPFVKVQTRKLIENDDWMWTATETMAIERGREMEDVRFREAIASISIREDSHGMAFGVFSLPGKISIVCSRILRDPNFKFLDYVIVVNSYGGIKGNLSVRSAEGFDCTQLGPINGHLAAAGGEVSPESAKRLLSESTAMLRYKSDDGWKAEDEQVITLS